MISDEHLRLYADKNATPGPLRDMAREILANREDLQRLRKALYRLGAILNRSQNVIDEATETE